MNRTLTAPACLAVLIAFVVALTGCHSPADDPTSSVPGKCNLQQPIQVPAPLDILFVIDNSSSMIEEQNGVATQLGAFLDAIRESPDIAKDFNLGVITTSVYLNARTSNGPYLRYYNDDNTVPKQAGRLMPVPVDLADGGTGVGTERVLSGTDPDVVAKFARLVRQGTNGSGQETPYEAARLGLIDLANVPLEEGGNKGFFRDGARLLVMVLSDEDDCSEMTRPPKTSVGADGLVDDCDNARKAGVLTPVQTYFDLFNNLTDSTGAHREVVWAEIAPVSRKDKHAELYVDTAAKQIRNVDCVTSNAPGFRHVEMANLWRPGDPDQLNLASICADCATCQPDYSQTMIDVATLVRTPQFMDIANVPDPGLLHIAITRADGSIQQCTESNQGLVNWEPPANGAVGRIHFQGDCTRRVDDKEVKIEILCAG